jgi:hypothetical protein
MHCWSVVECCLQGIPIIMFVQATCSSDVREPHFGYPCHIPLERFRLVCENICVIIVGSVGQQSCTLYWCNYCGICRPAVMHIILV